jgi:hypothetical protein
VETPYTGSFDAAARSTQGPAVLHPGARRGCQRDLLSVPSNVHDLALGRPGASGVTVIEARLTDVLQRFAAARPAQFGLVGAARSARPPQGSVHA